MLTLRLVRMDLPYDKIIQIVTDAVYEVEVDRDLEEELLQVPRVVALLQERMAERTAGAAAAKPDVEDSITGCGRASSSLQQVTARVDQPTVSPKDVPPPCQIPKCPRRACRKGGAWHSKCCSHCPHGHTRTCRQRWREAAAEAAPRQA